jgi:F420-0:gamma-glutamyl ligase
MGKLAQVPVAVIRGFDHAAVEDGTARQLVRDPGRDLFR